jgi:hypothetical protein
VDESLQEKSDSSNKLGCFWLRTLSELAMLAPRCFPPSVWLLRGAELLPLISTNLYEKAQTTSRHPDHIRRNLKLPCSPSAAALSIAPLAGFGGSKKWLTRGSPLRAPLRSYHGRHHAKWTDDAEDLMKNMDIIPAFK